MHHAQPLRLTRLHRLVLITLAAPTLALAQQAPDAGSLLREQGQPKLPSVTPPRTVTVPGPQEAAPTEAANEVRFLIKQINIQGAKLFAQEKLQAQLADLINQQASLTELKRAGNKLETFYKQNGYVARVLLPAQAIADGVVEFQVIEAAAGAIEVTGDAKRLDKQRIERIVANQQAVGEPIQLEHIASAVSLLNEQPGLGVKASLKAGASEGLTDVVVQIDERPLFNYSLQANNQGSPSTGANQLGGSLVVNNPSGLFDQGILTFNKADGSNYVRGDYGLLIGNSGSRASLNVSQLKYQVTQSSLAALQSRGQASTVGLAWQQPLKRSDALNLSLNANLDHKTMVDNTVAGEIDSKRVNVLGLALSGYGSDTMGGGGGTSFGLSLSSGELDLARNANSLAADLSTRQTQGSYLKLAYNLARQQALGQGITLSASLNGQVANKNLDSSERFTLGGPRAIRAYPIGEATGDQGWLARISANYSFSQQVTSSVFVEGGGVQLNKTTWALWNGANPNLPNAYTLKGAGVSMDWKFQVATLSVVIAAPLGNNPGADVNGLNADASHNHARGWISLTAQF